MCINKEVHLIKHKDLNIRLRSRSGGIFTAVSDVILSRRGVVYGCAINNEYLAEHRRATTKKERDEFLGSKYVQSNLGECFKLIKEDLLSDKSVLFSGTGCQVTALKSYLKDINTEKLFTIDIVCHGVPSPLIWKEFILYMENKYHGKVTSINFRDKRYGWMAYVETFIINGKRRFAHWYGTIFNRNYILRPCCYKCPYSSTKRYGDISIADAWGVNDKYFSFNDDKGCSLVIINSDKGKELFDLSKDSVENINVDLKDFMQPNLIKPSKLPKNRDEFWKDFYDNGFEFVSKKYGMNTLKGNLIALFKRILGRTKTTKYIKKIFKI